MRNSARTFLVLLSILTAFGARPSTALSAEKFKAATTFTVIADMARNVAGDAAEVVSITKPGAEIHNYQPTPKDIIKALDADLIFWNGLNLELWFEKFFNNIKKHKSIVFVQETTSIGVVLDLAECIVQNIDTPNIFCRNILINF